MQLFIGSKSYLDDGPLAKFTQQFRLGGVANNAATGAGLERVLTTSDLGGGVFHPQTFNIEIDRAVAEIGSDFPINVEVEKLLDPATASYEGLAYDDTVEEGVGLMLAVPTGATNIKFSFKSKARTAPVAARTVGVKLYTRNLPDNAAVAAWSAGVVLNDIDIPTNLNMQYDSQTLTLAALGITAGNLTQLELTRIAPSAGTNLTGDWILLQVIAIEFT